MRATRPSLLLLAAVLVLAGCGATAPPPLVLGSATDTVEQHDDFAAAVRAPVGLHVFFQAWEGRPDLDRARADAAAARGALPVLTWEPWAPGAGPDQPAYALRRIAAGDHDDYVRSFARQVAARGEPLGLRVLHELNGDWYPWAVGGGVAVDAVAAWTHLRALFAEEGADVVWVWTVTVSGETTVRYEEAFPGDDAVDWVALDGYNGGTALPWGGWRGPEELLAPDVARLTALSERPLLLGETASATEGGDKAAWVRDLLTWAPEAGVQGVVWFHVAKEADWRVTSPPAAAEAFREVVAEPGTVTARAPLPRRLADGGPATRAAP